MSAAVTCARPFGNAYALLRFARQVRARGAMGERLMTSGWIARRVGHPLSTLGRRTTSTVVRGLKSQSVHANIYVRWPCCMLAARKDAVYVPEGR